ncbi:MAG: hypothetical protein ACOX0A_09805 [Thermoguttaceae bacterium]|jgi:hypothetical protein
MFETLQKNLRAKKYAVAIVESGRATEYQYLSLAIRNTTVACSGSVTLDQIALHDTFSKSNVAFGEYEDALNAPPNDATLSDL